MRRCQQPVFCPNPPSDHRQLCMRDPKHLRGRLLQRGKPPPACTAGAACTAAGCSRLLAGWTTPLCDRLLPRLLPSVPAASHLMLCSPTCLSAAATFPTSRLLPPFSADLGADPHLLCVPSHPQPGETDRGKEDCTVKRVPPRHWCCRISPLQLSRSVRSPKGCGRVWPTFGLQCQPCASTLPTLNTDSEP